MKKLLLFLLIVLLASCGGSNSVSKVKDVIEKHPEAHSILFFDPETAIVAEGDKNKEPLGMDYITFSYGFVVVKMIGQEEIRLELENEPTFSSRGNISYPINSKEYSMSVNLKGCTFFKIKDNKLDISYFTESDELRMKEYLNILITTSKKNPPVLNRLIEAAKNSSDSYYSFD